MTRFLANPSIIQLIKQCVLKLLNSLKVVCYYGCQMVRPPKITGYADYEYPQTLDHIAAAAGAQVDPEKCSACLLCVRVCPYGAPFINEDGVSQIPPSACWDAAFVFQNVLHGRLH